LVKISPSISLFYQITGVFSRDIAVFVRFSPPCGGKTEREVKKNRRNSGRIHYNRVEKNPRRLSI